MIDQTNVNDNAQGGDGSGFANAVNAIGGLVGNVGDIINGEPIQTEVKLEQNTMLLIGGGILALILCFKKK